MTQNAATKRIEELTAAVAAQQSQIESLKAEIGKFHGPTVNASRPLHEGVRIISPAPSLPPEYPTAKEFDALNCIVAARYPQLAYAGDDQEGRQQYSNAFLYLFFAYRRDKPNTEYAIGCWVDAGREWLRRQALATNVIERALIAAAIVHGIPSTEPPCSSLGLTLGERTVPFESAWRQVLATGQCPDPVSRH
jgi:hypothetical protein